MATGYSKGRGAVPYCKGVLSMNKTFSPDTVLKPKTFSQGVEIGPNSRVVYVAGQVGVTPDGVLAKDIRGQTENAWINIRNVLAAAGMELTDIVKMNTYLLKREDIGPYQEVRGKFLGEHKPAGTALLIAGLGREAGLVEVEVVAAKSIT
jgi:2-iminobutanoate/2-iminopropanoate deaminase